MADLAKLAKRCEQAIDLVMGEIGTADGQVVVIAIDGRGRAAIHTREKRQRTATLDGELVLALRYLLHAVDLSYAERLVDVPPSDGSGPAGGPDEEGAK